MLRANFFETKRTWRARKALAFGLLAVTAALLFGLLAAEPAHAASTFVVNSTDDDPAAGPTDDGECTTAAAGECTLRAAIQEANRTKGKDTINFDIPTTGVATIAPASELPVITKPVTIDGYTQGDATENTDPQPGQSNAVLRIELVGTSAGPTADGLLIDASNGVVRGLVINRFKGSNIRLVGGKGHRVEGNFLGTDANGAAVGGSGRGVHFDDADGSTIGGTSPAARNLISGNDHFGTSSFGVWLQNPSSGNRIQGNLIGGNSGHGVKIDGSRNTVGGTDTDPTDSDDPANVILFNGGDGVMVGGTGNRIPGNSIFFNGGLGIDLGDDGVTDNDEDDADTGANRLQNYPVFTSASIGGGKTTINGRLNSNPGKAFTIQFFSSFAGNPPTDFVEGDTFLGQVTVKTDKQGDGSFTFTVDQDLTGQSVTTTATNTKTGDTSEFSGAFWFPPT